ncbi:MAG: Wzz/FepE/Etk N-terminal domain-containing protein [bacterium]|nr:Wzz/FepE/Etk N-terminal domain-containing protein [bacterium]
MERNIGIKDYIRVLIKWRRLVVLNVLIITCFAIGISFIIPKKYTATASLLPPLPGTEMLGISRTSGIASALSGIAGISGIPGLSATTSSDLFAAILKSKATADRVIIDCNLIKVYKTNTMKATYERLTKDTEIKVTPEGIITIATTAKTPRLAKLMADSYIRNLDNLNKKLTMSIGKRNRIFLESRLQEVKRDLKMAEDSLKRFQELHKTISIKEEIEPVLEAVSEIKAKIIANEVKLGVLQKYATEDNPEVIKVKSELSELNKRLHAMEYSGDSEHFGIGFSIPFRKIPKVGLQLARLTRDVMIQEKLLAILTEQYELAKTQEAKDTPTVDVLERASIPEHKSYPKRKIIVGLAFIFSLAVGIILAFFLNWIETLEPEERAKWKEIRAMVRRK